MTVTINGSGTIGGITAGGLPDATITQPDLAAGVAGTGPAFSAGMSTTQTISSGVFTKINFDTKNWDTNTNYSTTNYRFTPTIAGYYQVNCSVDAGASTGATRSIANIYKNGSVYRIGTNNNVVAGNAFSGVCSSQVYMNGSTDYIECYAYIAATACVVSPSPGTWFDAVLVRAA